MGTKPPTPPTREEDEPVEFARRRVPGVAVVFAGVAPAFEVVALVGGRVVVGREGKLRLTDDLVSREHAELAFDGERWTVRDLGSWNGTFADGARVAEGEAERVVRVGHTLLLLAPDAGRFAGKAVEVGDEMVVGPTLAEALGAARPERSRRQHLPPRGRGGARSPQVLGGQGLRPSVVGARPKRTLAATPTARRWALRCFGQENGAVDAGIAVIEAEVVPPLCTGRVGRIAGGV